MLFLSMHNDKYEIFIFIYEPTQINSSSRLYRSVGDRRKYSEFAIFTYIDGCQVINFELSIIMIYIRYERTYGQTNERTNERMNEWTYAYWVFLTSPTFFQSTLVFFFFFLYFKSNLPKYVRTVTFSCALHLHIYIIYIICVYMYNIYI